MNYGLFALIGIGLGALGFFLRSKTLVIDYEKKKIKLINTRDKNKYLS